MAAKKKISKKVSKKVANKVATKAPVAKKAAKKVAKKVTRKVSKKVTKKTAKKPAKKVTKKAARNKSATDRAEQLRAMLKENLGDLNSDKAEEVAKQIWLAGLGAYSRTFNEASERYDDLQERLKERNAEGQKVFDQLVERGASVQDTLEKAMQQGKDSLEERVADFKKRFGGGLSSYIDIPGRLRDAAEKIEELSEKLQKK